MSSTTRKVTIGGAEWALQLGTPKQHSELLGNEGITLEDEHRILINTEMVPAPRVPSVVFHGLMHAAADISGARHAVRESIGFSDARMELLEELIIRTWGQALFDTLQRNGWLKLPSK